MTSPPIIQSVYTDGLELISTAVLLLGSDARVSFANAAAELVLAQSKRQLMGAKLSDLFSNSEHLAPVIELAQVHKASYSEHELELHLAGKASGAARLLVDCTFSALEGMPETGPSLAIELRPLNHQFKIARETKIAEQNQANRELVRNLAHEIKNPLGGIRGAAQLLQSELEGTSNSEHIEYTQVIIHEADRLQNLVNRLLAPHKLPVFNSTDVHRILNHILQLMRNEYGATHTLTADFDVSLPEVECDAEQITQVLLNIARNACQSSAAHVTPSVTLKTRIARQVVLAKHHHRMALEISIIDNGPGIKPEDRDRIFFPLFTTREGGTGSGLGLSIAQTFIAEHRGTIEVESDAMLTQFRVLLPFKHPQPTTGTI